MLAFRSNKESAVTLTQWLASEVLPSIRKTGKYEAVPTPKALPEAGPLPPVPRAPEYAAFWEKNSSASMKRPCAKRWSLSTG